MPRGRSDIENLEATLGHRFRNRELLELALSHSSAPNERLAKGSNERLAFLGDAAWNLVASRLLYNNPRLLDKHQLTTDRQTVVNNVFLADVGRKLGLGAWIHMAEGAAKQPDQEDAILSDTVEALVAAVYLDAGFDAAAVVVARLLGGPSR